jgi:hypothetical protein
MLGDVWLRVAVFPRGRLPDSIKQFSLAGGINMWLEGDNVLLEQPTGCMLKLFVDLCKTALHEENHAQCRRSGL